MFPGVNLSNSRTQVHEGNGTFGVDILLCLLGVAGSERWSMILRDRKILYSSSPSSLRLISGISSWKVYKPPKFPRSRPVLEWCTGVCVREGEVLSTFRLPHHENTTSSYRKGGLQQLDESICSLCIPKKIVVYCDCRRCYFYFHCRFSTYIWIMKGWLKFVSRSSKVWFWDHASRINSKLGNWKILNSTSSCGFPFGSMLR